MSVEEISGEVFEYKSYPKNIFYLLNIFALLKVATEAMIKVSRVSLSEVYSMVAHPFRDEGGRISGVVGLSYPFLLLASLIFIFAFEKFEFGIFTGFCICFLLDNFMSKNLIRKASTYLPLDVEILSLNIQPEVVRSQVFRNSLFTAWRVVLLYRSKVTKDCPALDEAEQDIEGTIFYESENLQLTYSKALALSKAYGVSICFQDSDGANPELALKSHDFEEYKTLRRKFRQVIKDSEIAECRDLIVVKHKAIPYTIESHWNLQSYMQMTCEIFIILVKSFVLVIGINFLSFIGELAWGLLGSSPVQNMGQSLQSIQGTLFFWNYSNFLLGNFVDVFEMLIISGFLLSKSLDVSMSEIFRINNERLIYSLRFSFWGRERHQGSLAVREIKDIFFIKNPYSAIIISDSKNVIEITGLQKISEFKVLLMRLAEAIGFMRYKSRNSTP
ncbi:hypothetical protein H6F75_21910 [Nodosilinea sp. FACHB-131]|uniref:hypothetical protein n=1 Tax=Cyanophyceae TaxID=3028117 RepID=UPI001686C5B0|nr:hypothetical protein [Nodosilinea sp. FACHB-131]MBD1876144.1 hypothetical protein [Nodosilinea sp. FACHB-131]